MKFNEDVSFQNFARWWLSEQQGRFLREEILSATYENFRNAITEILVPTLQDLKVREIDVGAFEALRDATRHVPVVGNEVLALAHQMLTHAEKLGIRPPGTNPVLRIRSHAAPPRSPPRSAVDIEAVIHACEAVLEGVSAACHPNYAALFLFIALSGVRPSEAQVMRWRNLDPSEGSYGAVWFQRPDAETGLQQQVVVLTAPARKLLDELRGDSDVDLDAPMFPSHRKREQPYRKIHKAWRRLVTYAKREGLVLYDVARAVSAQVESEYATSCEGKSRAWQPAPLQVSETSADMSKLTFSKDVPFGIFAAAWLRERKEELRSGELAERTYLSYRRTVRGILIPALEGCTISDVSTQLMRALRRETSHIPAKGNQALNLARRILNVAERLGLRPPHSNPTQRVKPHPELASARPASPLDVHTVTQGCESVLCGESDVCHPNLAKIFMLIALTGARPSEIRDLRAGNLDLGHGKHGVLRLQRHKTMGTVGEKLIILSPDARKAIDRLGEFPSDPDAPLFPSHRCPTKPYRDISKAWRRLATDAGLDNINLRDLRSGLATSAHETGVDVKEIQGMLGHNDVRTTMGYIKLSPRRVGEAYEKVEAAREVEVRKQGSAKKGRTTTKKAKTVRKKSAFARRVAPQRATTAKWGGRRA